MKITAVVLAVVFAGSYISCVVQNEIDSYKKSSSAEITETVVSETTTVPEQTTVPETVISEVTAPVIQMTVTEAETAAETVITTIETTAEETEPVTEATTTVSETTVPAETEPPVPEYDYSSPVPESPAKDSSYYDKCVFIGDSHINGMGGYGIINTSRVFAKDGMSISHVNDYISVEGIKATGAENVYIMMGTNGVMWTDWNTMVSQYETFVKQVVQALPDANIYILSIPPVTHERETRADVAGGKFLNSDIDQYNQKLQKMAESNKWYYVNVNPSLKDANGCLPSDSSTDGIHMKKDLYSNVFSVYILSHTVNK